MLHPRVLNSIGSYDDAGNIHLALERGARSVDPELAKGAARVLARWEEEVVSTATSAGVLAAHDAAAAAGWVDAKGRAWQISSTTFSSIVYTLASRVERHHGLGRCQGYHPVDITRHVILCF
jgi:hypothetical protein